MPATTSGRAFRRLPCAPICSDLRPDLAAFFALASHELAPRRIDAEHGVLAELREIRGFD